MNDEIMQELWQIKDELAREANCDVRVLCQKLREHQAASRERIVDRSAEFSSSVGSFERAEGSAELGRIDSGCVSNAVSLGEST
jgi:hypothetical protein